MHDEMILGPLEIINGLRGVLVGSSKPSITSNIIGPYLARVFLCATLLSTHNRHVVSFRLLPIVLFFVRSGPIIVDLRKRMLAKTNDAIWRFLLVLSTLLVCSAHAAVAKYCCACAGTGGSASARPGGATGIYSASRARL